MKPGRLLTIALNALAFLVLGMAGAAIANVVAVDQLSLYGPEVISGLQTFLQVAAGGLGSGSGSAINSYIGVAPISVSLITETLPTQYYAVAPNTGSILTLAQSVVGDAGFYSAVYSLDPAALTTPLQFTEIALLPPSDPIFATPLPSAASLFVCGVAALAFVARLSFGRRARAAASGLRAAS